MSAAVLSLAAVAPVRARRGVYNGPTASTTAPWRYGCLRRAQMRPKVELRSLTRQLCTSASRSRVSALHPQVYAAATASSEAYVQFGQFNAKVILTREKGNNGKLERRLAALGMETVEMPLIEFSDTEGFELLPETMKSKKWDWIIITSPEAAKTFLRGWEKAGKPAVRLAVVGQGTADEFEGIDAIDVAWMPSKATGQVLAEELPVAKAGEQVLYACSAKAGSDVEDCAVGLDGVHRFKGGLTARGFEVTRLDTYTTQNVSSVSAELMAEAKSADIVTFASPSTVKAWVAIMGDAALGPNAARAVCIGETSAKASKEAGLSKVFFPEKPGIDGWVDSAIDSLKC